MTNLDSVDAEASYVAGLDELRAEVGRLVRRLRSLTGRSLASRRDSVTSLLAELAELSALAERRTAVPLPALPDYSLTDAVGVLSGDLLDALAFAPNPDVLTAAQHAVRTAWAATN